MGTALRIALIVITVGCVFLFVAHPLWFPAGASAQARLIDHDFSIAFWLLGALFIAGQIVLVWVLLRRQSRKAVKHWYGNGRFEVAWTVAIAAIFFWFHVSGGRLWSSISMHHAPPGALQVEVTGVQFQWYFRYPGPDGKFGRVDAQKFARPDEGNPLGMDPADAAGKDDIVSTSLVLPADRNIDLTLRAQDVVHSLFIPAMRFKQDTVPGMEIHSQLKPTQVGTYEIACAELCGLGHYRMRAMMRVVREEEFEHWLKARANSAANSRE
jgi:cytochrome c oxidase subunit II